MEDFSSNTAEEILRRLEPIFDEIKSKWREIGQSLGIEAELNSAEDEGELLRQVIIKWVEKSLGANMWPPLLDALGNQTTSNIISELRENYCRVVYTDDMHMANNGWKDFKLTWIDPAVTILLLAVVIYGLLHVREMDELDKYMSEHPLDADKWQEISARPIHILLTGKTGTGKSSLINGIIGKNVTKEGDTLRPETSKVEHFKRIVNGVPMEVFDSPGLQDGTENEKQYIIEMGEKCKDVDLILYTVKMTDTRVHEDDKDAMEKLTVAFGEAFWRKTMFVLTFANNVRVPERPGEHDYERNKEHFETKWHQWKTALPMVLQKLNVSYNVVSKVPIVPAGHYRVQDLPGRKYWFSTFWRMALDRMKDASGEDRVRFMLEYSKDRWQKVYEASVNDFDEELYKQRIFEAEHERKRGWW